MGNKVLALFRQTKQDLKRMYEGLVIIQDFFNKMTAKDPATLLALADVRVKVAAIISGFIQLKTSIKTLETAINVE